MARQKFPCKNHSEKQTTKRCYVCKDYICSECQNQWSHHLFCGYYCYIKFFSSGYLKFLKSNLKIISLILFIQLISVLIILQIVPDVESDIRNPEKDFEIIEKISDTTNVFRFDILSTPIANRLVLSGQTKPNSLLGLWHNDVIIQSTISKDTNYQFKPISLHFGLNKFIVIRVDSSGKNILIDSLQINYSSTRIQQLMQSVSKVQTNNKIFSLTFDGGSITTGADSILHILKENNIQTTFFLTGKFIIRNPELTQKIIDNGHEIGNHSYSHPHFTQFESNFTNNLLDTVDRAFVQKELLKTDSVFYAKFNQNLIKFWRAPFGEYNRDILQWAAEIGFKHIRWSKNGDLADWVIEKESKLYKTSDELCDHVVEMMKNEKLKGSIVLMHFGTRREEEQPYKMLPKLIKILYENDYKIVKITNLLKLQISS